MGVTMKPQQHIYDHYAQLDDITEPPQASTEIGRNGSKVDILRGVNEKNGTEVKQVFVHNEGHLWFGGLGDETSAVNATDMVVDFLLSHSKKPTKQD
jgi:poly(3-hydroxybutyrate) depolymerase